MGSHHERKSMADELVWGFSIAELIGVGDEADTRWIVSLSEHFNRKHTDSLFDSSALPGLFSGCAGPTSAFSLSYHTLGYFCCSCSWCILSFLLYLTLHPFNHLRGRRTALQNQLHVSWSSPDAQHPHSILLLWDEVLELQRTSLFFHPLGEAGWIRKDSSSI